MQKIKVYITGNNHSVEQQEAIITMLKQKDYDVESPKDDLDYLKNVENAILKMKNDSEAKGIFICNTGRSVSEVVSNTKSIKCERIQSFEDIEKAVKNKTRILCFGIKNQDLETMKKWLDYYFSKI